MNKNIIKVTVLFEKQFWVGIFERKDNSGYTVARKVFGAEPSDAELYDFVLHHYDELKFSAPLKNVELVIKRKNPKRLQREVRREMQRLSVGIPETRAQEALRLELEKNKKLRKANSKIQKEAEEKARFQQKQLKRKQKKRGR